MNESSKLEHPPLKDNYEIRVGNSGLSLEEAKKKIEELRSELREQDSDKEAVIETPEHQKKIIMDLNECFDKEMRLYGVKPQKLELENFWTLNYKSYERGYYSGKFKLESGNLIKKAKTNEIIYKKRKIPKDLRSMPSQSSQPQELVDDFPLPEDVWETAHEMFHLNGRKISYLQKYDDGGFQEIPMRIGYSIINPNTAVKEGKNPEWDDHFLGLNEAITERLTSEFLYKYFDKLVADRVDYKKEEILDREHFEKRNISAHSYIREVNILDQIINQISKESGKDKDVIWEDVKRGYFTSDTQFTRMVEKTFGPGSLRVLSEMNSTGRAFFDSKTGKTTALKMSNQYNLFVKYFDLSIPLEERQKMVILFFDNPDKIEGQKYMDMIQKAA